MKLRSKTVVGIVSAAAAAALMVVYAASVGASAKREREAALERYGGEQVEVCVAQRELAAGETVTEEDVEEREWLVDLVPEGAALSVDDVVGRTVVYPIAENEPVVTARVTAVASSLDVPDGKVAVSVPSDDVTAVGGSVQPGTYVDVYSSGSSGTSLLAKSVLVLETSASVQAESGTTLSGSQGRSQISWVTLAVEPNNVEQIVAVGKSGGLYFALAGADADSGSNDVSTEDAESDGSDAQSASSYEWKAGEGTMGADAAASGDDVPSASDG
jgi:pilus assembly protein CpaB